jgi:lysophospholipase L1-like esterase
MRARLGIIVGILMIGFGWLGPAGAEAPKVEKTAPQTILFLGDSITQAGGYVRIIEAELAKQIPSNSWRVINHGRNSETVSDLSEVYHPGRRPCVLSRIDEELKQTKPDWVVACYGINCGIYHPFNEKRFAAYQAGIETFIKKVHASGARVILLTAPPYAYSGPFPEGSDAAAREAIVAKANTEAEAAAEKDPNKFGYKTPYPYYDYVMARYAKWLLTLNGRKDVWVVDLREAMLPKIKEAHGRDPIHPNGLGHAIMAEAFLKQWPAIQAQVKGK